VKLKLTASERQALVGPLVIGCLLGAFVALASWGFDGEYSHIDRWRMTLNAVVAFVAAVAIAAVPLGVLPIASGACINDSVLLVATRSTRTHVGHLRTVVTDRFAAANFRYNAAYGTLPGRKRGASRHLPV